MSIRIPLLPVLVFPGEEHGFSKRVALPSAHLRLATAHVDVVFFHHAHEGDALEILHSCTPASWLSACVPEREGESVRGWFGLHMCSLVHTLCTPWPQRPWMGKASQSVDAAELRTGLLSTVGYCLGGRGGGGQLPAGKHRGHWYRSAHPVLHTRGHVVHRHSQRHPTALFGPDPRPP